MRRSWQRSVPPPSPEWRPLPANDAAPVEVMGRRRDGLRRWVGIEAASLVAGPNRVGMERAQSSKGQAQSRNSGMINFDSLDGEEPFNSRHRVPEAQQNSTGLNPVRWWLWIVGSFFSVSVWIVRFVVRAFSSLRRDQIRCAELRDRLERATTYHEWYSVASDLDDLEYNTDWKTASSLRRDREYCDIPLLRARLREMRKLHVAGDMRGLVFTLQAGLLRHFAGLDNPELHAHSLVGTKLDVEDYLHAVAYFLEDVATSRPNKSRPGAELDQDATALVGHEKLTFFNEARHAYGRTALVLAGGFAMGVDHLGASRVLLRQGLLPRVLVGVASGAISASFLGVYTNEELEEKMKSLDECHRIGNSSWHFDFSDNASPLRKMIRFATTGVINDVAVLQDCARRNIGDITFEEAYLRTKRILNIIISPADAAASDGPIVLNYLTTPHVAIWSAVAASAALPLLYSPVELMGKNVSGEMVPFHLDGMRWVDGGVKGNLPLSRISELFNVNHFLVSRTSTSNVSQHSFWLRSTPAQLLCAELRFRYSLLQEWNLTPRFLASIFPNVDPNLHSRVTIPCLLGLSDIPLMFRSPRPSEIPGLIHRGEQCTFPTVDRVYHRCLLELSLEWWVEQVARDIQRRPTTPARALLNRVPSWLWHESGTLAPSRRASGEFGRAISRRESHSLEFAPDELLSTLNPMADASGSDDDAPDDDEFDERIMC